MRPPPSEVPDVGIVRMPFAAFAEPVICGIEQIIHIHDAHPNKSEEKMSIILNLRNRTVYPPVIARVTLITAYIHTTFSGCKRTGHVCLTQSRKERKEKQLILTLTRRPDFIHITPINS